MRWLLVPGAIAIVAGAVLVFVRTLGVGGVIAGGLLFAAGIDMVFIGGAQPPPRLRHA